MGRSPGRSFQLGELVGHRLEVRRAGADGRPQVRRGHERRVEVGLLGQAARSTSPRLRWTVPRSGSSRPAAMRRSVVLPAPFGPTSPTRSPSAMAASIRSRITNVPISRVTPPVEGWTSGRSRPGAAVVPATPDAARAAARRVAAARFVRAVRAARPRAASRPPRRWSGRAPPRRRARSTAAPAAPVAARDSCAGSPWRPAGRCAGRRWHHEQKCVARTPTTIRRIGRPQRRHGSPVRW